jgi:tetratricopeptide (TPR) repeat protein
MLAGSLSDLARREAVLLTCLALAAALVALAKVVDREWLTIAGLSLAFVGGVLRVSLTVRRGQLERARETATLSRRTLVPIGEIGQVDPTDVGVDAAAPQDVLPGERVPKYLARHVDAALDSAFRTGLDGGVPWIVVAVGSSKVGKSRALFEALRRYAETNRLDFVAPTDGEALAQLLTPDERPSLQGDGAVLWLDDLEPFLNDGTTLQVLREWHEQSGYGVVAATYGGKGNDLVGATGSEALATVAGEVLQHSAEILVEPTSTDELGPLRATISGDDVAAIESHGLAAYLVAAPELQRKLTTHRHAPGEPENPEGVAVTLATVDWARCGRTDPIPEETLRRIWTEYLPTGMRATRAGFEQALDWALLPVAGSIALLEHSQGFQAYDYLVRFVAGQPTGSAPRDPVWASALEEISGSQALAVGIVADAYGRRYDAVKAFEIAQKDPTDVTAAIGGVDLGIALGDVDRPDEALAAYDEVVSRFGESPGEELREQVAKALFNKGVQLGKLDRSEEAIAAYDEVVARFGSSSLEAQREAVSRALVNKGMRLGRLNRHEDEIAVYEEVVSRFEDVPDEPSQEAVGRALFNKAVTLGELDRRIEELDAYDNVIERFGETDAYALRDRVAKTLLNKGIKLGELGRVEDELETYEEIVARCGVAEELGLREILAMALTNMSKALGREAGRSAEVIVVCDDIMERFGGSAELIFREQVATALNDKAIALGELSREDESLLVLDEMVARFGDAEESVFRGHVVRALNNKGVALAVSGRPEDAIEVYDEVIARFGDAEEPIFYEGVARSLRGKGVAFGRLERFEEEIPTYNELAARFGEVDLPAVQVQVASGKFNEGVRLGLLGPKEEAIVAFNDLMARFGDADEPAIRQVVARTAAALREMQESATP